MTGAGPETTGNYFAMSLMPIGYKRAYWEPKFNIPFDLRSRLCMTEDQEIDFEYGSFKNPDTNQTIESIWDVMQDNGKKFAVEACVALGVRSYHGITTHGARTTRLIKDMEQGVDLAYIQLSETDQQLHARGTGRIEREPIIQWADDQVKLLYEKAHDLYTYVDLIVFGDHGMMDVTEHVDLPLEYPPFTEGWDYMYLKSSAAIQFWVFNPKVENRILNDPKLKQHGSFINSPSKRQGDIIWAANPGVLVSPCHFHPRWDAPRSMHGYDPKIPEMHGFALAPSTKPITISKGTLNDICPIICDSVGIPYPRFNEGRNYAK